MCTNCGLLLNSQKCSLKMVQFILFVHSHFGKHMSWLIRIITRYNVHAGYEGPSSSLISYISILWCSHGEGKVDDVLLPDASKCYILLTPSTWHYRLVIHSFAMHNCPSKHLTWWSEVGHLLDKMDSQLDTWIYLEVTKKSRKTCWLFHFRKFNYIV